METIASMDCRFGILGPGRIAERFAGTFRQGLVRGAKLVSVASRSLERARAFAETLHISAYGNYADLCADPEVDVVYVATTNNAHYENCLQCLRAKKHVLCEKPLVLTAAEAESLARAAEENGVFLMEGLWSLFLPAMQRAREWVLQGRIGELKAISTTFCAFREPAEYARLYDPELDGGAMYDTGVYNIHVTNFFAGRKLEQVAAVMAPSGTGVDESSHLLLKYEGGLIGNAQCSIAYAARNEAYLQGTRGYIRIAPFFSFAQQAELFVVKGPTRPFGYQAPTADELFTSEFSSGFEYEIEHVARCVKAGRLQSDILPLSATIQTIRIFEEAKRQGWKDVRL